MPDALKATETLDDDSRLLFNYKENADCKEPQEDYYRNPKENISHNQSFKFKQKDTKTLRIVYPPRVKIC